MKKIIASSLSLFVSLPLALNAATVSIGVGSDIYTVDGQTWTVGATIDEPVYLPGSLASPSVNAGEEFVYLGVSSAGVSGAVNVNLQSSHGGATGPISLLLSASESTTWVLNPADLGVVDLRNIFVVASASTQTIQLGTQSLVLNSPGDVDSLLTTNDVARLPVLACGYKYDTSETDCNTASILGLAGDANPFGLVTYLADFFAGNASYDELQVTNFAGSHFADSFNVSIDSVAIPLPAAFWLFGSGILGLQFFSRKRQYKAA